MNWKKGWNHHPIHNLQWKGDEFCSIWSETLWRPKVVSKESTIEESAKWLPTQKIVCQQLVVRQPSLQMLQAWKVFRIFCI